MKEQDRVVGCERLRLKDVDRVGGKNASLGEMIGQLAAQGIRVPGGFATTASAYREFLSENGLEQRIHDALAGLDVDDVESLARAGAAIRSAITAAKLPVALVREVEDAYRALCEGAPSVSVAVRSSATAEDLAGASFAGQQE